MTYSHVTLDFRWPWPWSGICHDLFVKKNCSYANTMILRRYPFKWLDVMWPRPSNDHNLENCFCNCSTFIFLKTYPFYFWTKFVHTHIKCFLEQDFTNDLESYDIGLHMTLTFTSERWYSLNVALVFFWHEHQTLPSFHLL